MACLKINLVGQGFSTFSSMCPNW